MRHYDHMTNTELKIAIAQMGIKQGVLADMLGIHQATLSAYVNGKRDVPKMLVWAVKGVLSGMKGNDCE